jgi:IS5 family transposase
MHQPFATCLISSERTRTAREHPIGTWDILRNKRISRIRSPGERRYAVITNVFHHDHIHVITVVRVQVKMIFAAFSFNLYQLRTLKKQFFV